MTERSRLHILWTNADHRDVITILDPDLKKYQTIWAAAGTPNAVFELNPHELECLTNGRWVTLAE